jgi:Zn-dependent protease
MIRWSGSGAELRLRGLPPIWIDLAVPVVALILCGPVWIGLSPNELATGSLIVPMLMLSILAHELGHALVARRWGLTPIAIRLHAGGGEAVFDGHAPNRTADWQITLAGPLANLLIGLACLSIAWLLTPTPQLHPGDPWFEPLPAVTPPMVRALAWSGWANLALMAINLLPAMPLDGGHLTYSVLERRLGPNRALFWVGLCGVILGIVLWPVCLAWAVLGVPIWLPPSIPPNWAAMRRAAATRRAR